jgi:hypothetical protein
VKIVYGSSDIDLSLTGVSVITKTTNRPTVVLQPNFACTNTVAAAKQVSVRYVEAYNT